jgi:hypothetical protein
MVAIVMLRVVLERATHRYRSAFGSPAGEAEEGGGCWPWPGVFSVALRTMINDTARQLLNGN